MKILFQWIVMGVLIPLSPLAHAAEHPDTAGWQELFNPDLSNAMAAGKWSMKDTLKI